MLWNGMRSYEMIDEMNAYSIASKRVKVEGK